MRDPDTFTLLGMAHEYYAKFMMRMDRPYVAYEHFHIAYLICREVFGERHEQTVVLMNSLGKNFPCLSSIDERRVADVAHGLFIGGLLYRCCLVCEQ